MPLLRTRILYLAALGLTVALGLFSRAWPLGWHVWDKSLGDALYAVAVYLVFRLLLPTFRVSAAGALAVGFCLLIESFKFTGMPASWAGWRLSRLVLGTTPSWHNVLCYVAGVAMAVLVEACAKRPWKVFESGSTSGTRN